MANMGDMLKGKSTPKPKPQSGGWQNLPNNPNQATKKENLPYVPNPSDGWKNLPYKPNQTTKSSYDDALAQIQGKLNGGIPNPQYNAQDLYNQAMQQSLNANAQAMANAVAQAEANRGQIKQVYDSAQKQNYINNVMGAKNLSESLIANGLDKQGFTESSKLAHEGNYQTNFANTESSRNAEIAKLNNEIAFIKSEYGLRGSQITENYLNMLNDRLYQVSRDKVADSQLNKDNIFRDNQFDWQKGQDIWSRGQADIQNGFQESGITGMYKGKPTYQNSQDAWKNGMTKEQWEWQKKQDNQQQKNFEDELKIAWHNAKKSMGGSGGGASGSYSGNTNNNTGAPPKAPASDVRDPVVKEVSGNLLLLTGQEEKAKRLIAMHRIPTDKNGKALASQGYLTDSEFFKLVSMYGLQDYVADYLK